MCHIPNYYQSENKMPFIRQFVTGNNTLFKTSGASREQICGKRWFNISRRTRRERDKQTAWAIYVKVVLNAHNVNTSGLVALHNDWLSHRAEK